MRQVSDVRWQNFSRMKLASCSACFPVHSSFRSAFNIIANRRPPMTKYLPLSYRDARCSHPSSGTRFFILIISYHILTAHYRYRVPTEFSYREYQWISFWKTNAKFSFHGEIAGGLGHSVADGERKLTREKIFSTPTVPAPPPYFFKPLHRLFLDLTANLEHRAERCALRSYCGEAGTMFRWMVVMMRLEFRFFKSLHDEHRRNRRSGGWPTAVATEGRRSSVSVACGKNEALCRLTTIRSRCRELPPNPITPLLNRWRSGITLSFDRCVYIRGINPSDTAFPLSWFFRKFFCASFPRRAKGSENARKNTFTVSLLFLPDFQMKQRGVRMIDDGVIVGGKILGIKVLCASVDWWLPYDLSVASARDYNVEY